MPCGCFGKKKKTLEEEEKYRQRDSKSREREPPILTPTPAPVPPTAAPVPPSVAAPSVAAATPEGDARLRPEDDPDKANRRRDVVASFYNDQCELIGFKATGSRPPSTLVGGAHHDGLTPRGGPPLTASCRADLAEKRREFFKQLTIESDDGSSLPGTRPGSRSNNSASHLKGRDSQHEEGMNFIQAAKSSLRPVKTSPQSEDLPYIRSHNLTEEEVRGLEYRKARELMLKDIRQHAFTLRPSTEKVQFKNMLPEEEGDHPELITNGVSGTTPLIMERRQISSVEPNKKGDIESVVSHAKAKVNISIVETIAKAKRSEQMDPEFTELLDNLSGQEISELLDDLSEPEIDLLPTESPKPQCSLNQEAKITSNILVDDLALNSHPSKTEPEIVMQQSSTGFVSVQSEIHTDQIYPVSSGIFATEIPLAEDKEVAHIPTTTAPLVAEIKQEPIQLPPVAAPTIAEVKEEAVEVPATTAPPVAEIKEPVQLPPEVVPVVPEEVKEETAQLSATPPPITAEIKEETDRSSVIATPPVTEVKEEILQLPADAPSSAIEVQAVQEVQLVQLPAEEVSVTAEEGAPLEDVQVVSQQGQLELDHAQLESAPEGIYLTEEKQEVEDAGDPGTVLLPPSVDPSFLRTEEEPDELLLQQSLHQSQPLPVEETAPSLPEPVRDPSPQAPVSIPSPLPEEELPPVPPTPPSAPEPTPTPLVMPYEEIEHIPSHTQDQVPAQTPVEPHEAVSEPLTSAAEPQNILEEPLPPAPPTPPLEEEPLPPAPPTPPISSSPRLPPPTESADMTPAPQQGQGQVPAADEGGPRPAERLAEENKTEQAAASS